MGAPMFYPPDARSFFEIVWDIVQQIPVGMVSSYGQIASMIPAGQRPGACSHKESGATLGRYGYAQDATRSRHTLAPRH